MLRRIGAKIIAIGCVGVALIGAAAALAAPRTGIEPKADEVLRRWCDRLKETRQFRVSIDESFDSVLESGEKVQYSNRRTVAVRRPNRAYAEVNGDTVNRRVYYDGSTITLFETAPNVYGVIPAKPTIDATLGHMAKAYSIHLPLGDWLFADPYQVMTEKVKAGTYQGLHFVGETKCHHLAFTQDTADWQVWIDAGEQPLLRKVVISYKQLPGQPQYIATLRDWELNAALADAMFRFTAPPGSFKIDVLPTPSAAPGGEPSIKP